MIQLIFLLVGLLLGGLASVVIIKGSKTKWEAEHKYILKDKENLAEQLANAQDDLAKYEEQIDELKSIISEQKTTIANLELKIENYLENLSNEKTAKALLEKKNEDLQDKIEQKQKELSNLEINLLDYKNKNKYLSEKLDKQKSEIEEIQKKFTESFKNLANDILEEKSFKFTKLNQENLDSILHPLQEKIKDFQSVIQQTNKENLLSNNSLIEQINNLKELNKQISEEANNLTKALKGDVKVQGNWGEVILERILEESGLRKGEGYDTQVSFPKEDGGRNQPDVIVHLPDSKDIIVDSKVSLVHYENFVAADKAEDRTKYVKLLSSSIKTHIDGLHKKHYHEISDINTPDFVLLFMPIEGSFATVMQNDHELYKYALDRHIVIVSPSTLLATLRTIAFIWRQENQTKNALEIARQSGALYDKFVGFLKDLENIGTNVDKAKEAYDKAVNKLKTGRGNLVGRVEKLKKLGAKASKSIEDKFLPTDDNSE
jgi:DNA recombination protein RmuC